MIDRGAPRVRLVPVEYGFGPTGKALHVARELRKRLGGECQLDLDISPQFAAMAEEGLCQVLTPESMREQADVVVAVMNSSAIAEAAGRGERSVYVDSLAWLRNEPPRLPGCDRYLYQDLPFLPTPAEVLDGLPSLAVGAICDSVPVATTTSTVRDLESGQGYVLSLAGVENFEVSVDQANAWYAKVILDTLGNLAKGWSDWVANTTVFGNERVLAWAGDRGAPWRRGQVAQRMFLGQARAARRAIVSPGLTSLVELLLSGVAISLLPPQNYSQLRITRALRDQGAAIPSLSWESEALAWLSENRVPERVGTQIVRGHICERHFSGPALTQEEFASLFDCPLPPVAKEAATGLVGEPTGAAEVAEVVVALLGR